ncbi:uncharacterized protein At4g18490 [Cucurbita maxima]|uniref:Uncharacterized protein At4g18490 n=1 Tax=Cucurbita maxima TaxID=3661 RepID=A0A6J1INH0_CUCMA|nr:uncharacterized protein At4g18490 [Cucurbita maxima]XP_022978661.1 uncharacterized protein At4g18490 [Cucurbita maxima]
MAEPRKGASLATDPRKKDSLLDEDIGDEFMNSWKSISVAEDDMVDFSFGTVSKGKNKAFDFGTLDVDFNLDGSFEKLSSFKIDMPDLDFSSPPKKNEKARSSCKEGSPKENLQRDMDSLNFSFDFKELDSFDVDKSLQNGERTCKQQQDTEAVSSSRVEHEAFNIHIGEENTATDNTSIAKRLPSSGNETSSRVENFHGDHGELESEVADGTSHEARNTAPATNEKGCLPENELSKGSHQVIHDVPVRCIARNYAPECTSEPQSEICAEKGELTVVSGGTGKVTDEIVDSDVACCKKLPHSYLSPIDLSASERNPTEKNKSKYSHLNEVVDNVQLAEVHLVLKDCSNSDAPRKLLLDRQEIRENHKPSMVPLCRGLLVNEVTVKEKEVRGNYSISKTDVVRKSQLYQASSISTKLFTLGNNRIDAPNQIPEAGDRNRCRDSRPQNKLANTAPPVVVQSEKSVGKLRASSPRVKPSNLCGKTTTQAHCNPELWKLSMIPNRSAKTISAQESKLCSLKTGLIFPGLSSLKTYRAFGGKQVPTSTGTVKERKLGESEQTTEAGQRSKKLDIGYCTENAEKQELLISNMKRKALEEPNADPKGLKPLKHLCVSPSGSRNTKEPLKKKIEEQVESMTTASHDQLGSNIENPRVPKTMELEISLVLENDRNVEKAEAYSQQLEDICNMLRKKQEEAKEILVRAIVNNNNLLLLNHPIYEEKIMKLQKFAAKLLSKELQKKAA